MLSEPQNALYWPPDVAPYSMESLVFLSSGWLRTACVLSALFWVAYRGYQVLSKPIEDLVLLLGLEVPVAPIFSLAGIKADGVLLHWKPPDSRASVLKYVIRINGIDIGDVSPQETSVTIENLKPESHYTIRIVTLNSANFQAPSDPIRLKTLPSSSQEFFNAGPHKEAGDGNEDDEWNQTPIIRPNKNLAEIIPPLVAPAMTREHSNSISRARRSEPGRRNSPASQTTEQARAAQESADSMDSIKQLTEKLDALRREIDDVEKQMQEEDEEFQTSKACLMETRNEKKTALKEKEDASRDLRKEVATLERANASAQTRRTQQEKLLQQKENERKKLKEDVARWELETGELRAAAEAIEQERAEYESTAEERIQELKDRYAEGLQVNKSLEEVIREKGTQIKALEEERKNLEEGEEVGDAQDGSETADAEEDRRWFATLTSLQQRYAHAWSLFTEAERAGQEAMSRLHFLQQRRLSQPHLFAGIAPQEPVPRRRNSQRSRPVSMREPLLPSVPGGFIPSSAAPFNTSINNVSPPFQNATPYFNFNNGMALPPPSNNASSFSAAEIESLTGGAPMSPTAGALLPSGLFLDDTGLTDVEDTDDDGHGAPMPILDPSPNLRNVLPGLGAPGTIEDIQSPSSPVSPQSRSPSLFASPRESAGYLGHFPPNDSLLDSDRRSIRSTSSSFMNNPQTTRFGGLFGLHRQRGKTLSDGPPLGSLKPSQSQSLPRQEHGSLDPIGSQRRRGSHSGGAWYDSLKFGSKPQPQPQPDESSTSPKHVATRKRGFNMFGTKGDPWLTSILGSERPSSPRQGSTKSGEANVLPRPSTESQMRFGWSVDAFGSRSSPLGVDWSVSNMNNGSSWSRMPSRRPSLQHGSTVSLVNDDMLQDDILLANTRSPTQAPIGTRPQSSASHMAQPIGVPPTPPKQLNPAAPVFKGIFTREKRSEEEKAEIQAEKAKKAAEKAAEKEAKKAEKEERKAAKADKSDKTKGKEKMLSAENTGADHGKDGTPPLDIRYSKDNRSISTADVSEASPRESLDRSLSHTPSESLQGSISKESFLQKLSRKGSTSQFLSLGKGKTSLFSKKPTDAITPDEMDEDGSGYMGRSVDSPAHSPAIGTPKDKSSSLGWSSFKRMSKRGEKTPSLHESIASETTGDEDDEDPETIVKA
ncbi:hypothetical protein BU24DRAFT_490783 [Aaosphaeria arxii CBS 175.79]|uniref:Fibronectin type-III domain-containing protein n=1 Tax=Aaosphaeria arxii CBS 175.79 TaxID=1450172 RepID=A0A6A5XXV7_9PLEO|nr:uncharacterized protein BU24DRAFT_490783 [Aaosphaeria arxii CBS 175.79]KAF2017657.1 hypothetical protein BU24DRAFT_490783 [Aaosphaeria arxii CBS 175.79]